MTETQARRPIPHVASSPGLVAAVAAVMEAKRLNHSEVALKLCDNPMDVTQVRDALQGLSEWFTDAEFFFPDDPDGELKAVEHLILLAHLLREHLRLGNYT